MADNTDETTTQQTQTTTDAQGSPASNNFVTKDDLKSFADSMMANFRRVQEGMQKGGKSKPDTSTSTQQTSQPDDFKEILRRERAFEDALSEHTHLNRQQRQMMRTLFEKSGAENIDEFVAQNAAVFGKPASNQPATETLPVTSAKPPITAVGSPASGSAPTEDTPLWKRSQQDRDHILNQDNGYQKYMKLFERQVRGVNIKVR